MRWLIVGFRTSATWIVGVLMTIICAILVLIAAFIKDTSPVVEMIIRFWCRTWLVMAGAKVTVEGQENIDLERSYVVVANHLSTLDIMAAFLAIRLPIRFLAKTELFKIPLFAQGMRAVGMVEVDRQARGAVHATVNRQAKELIAKKRSLIIYPEGTRPRNGVMKRFKKGAFTMAVAAQLPVLPMTIHGSYEAFPPGKPWVYGGPIQIVIDPPIDTKGLDHSDTGKLRDQVYEIISANVISMGGEVVSG
jgi:1-acyl-sn-glycerol-3-phosphate acyltransferase